MDTVTVTMVTDITVNRFHDGSVDVVEKSKFESVT